MVNSKTTISTLALSALTAAAPFSSNTNFSISQVPVKIPAAHPAAIYAEAHARLGVEVPHHVALAARCGWKDSVIALPYSHDIVYLTPIQFGADTLQVYLDTASGNTWAYTAETPSVGSHGVYNPQTGRLLSDYYWRSRSGQSIVFGGRVFLDKLKLNHLLYPEQAIQVVDFVQPIEVMLNPARAYDAILGLAFPEKNTVKPVKQPTFFENIREMLQAPLFAAFLRHQAPGGYDFGWIDSSKYQGSLAWTPVHASLGLWNISVSGYSIGDDVFSSTPFFAVIDTGTTLVLLEESIVQAYYQRT
ncbi:hypothetical protein EYB26_002417 [Talaromyces marneffei]|uniref:uncharacterized protein n=1 Tax=Talaromyces marneffei TaxID=37727 RepID=UPI0012A9B026|nr:uncharacterized protein EYB26_002417 [Talaromyces marneffei]QGA14761.1 hypothetical protein EYB26_002417 [Talaromyces marneffei]